MSELFNKVPQAPPDAIFGVAVKFRNSPLQKKALLSVGVYRTEEGKPYVFPAVAKAEDKIIHNFPKDYLPMEGHGPFVKVARELLWADLLPSMGERIASIQSCAGTGALFQIAKLAKDHLHFPKVLLSNPNWPNYNAIFGGVGHQLDYYPWAKNCEIDMEGALAKFNSAPDGCLVILQACAHNPTGIDPTPEQWDAIFATLAAKNHTILFDFAYMGYASGDIDVDAEAVRKFATMGRNFFVSFSFSKSMGLYGERIGCVHAVCSTKTEADAVASQMATVARGTYSVPPQNGALIAAEVLGCPTLKAQWIEELKVISKRVIDIRGKFVDHLNAITGTSWEFIRKQKGMFALTGLTPEEVTKLGEREGVFIPQNGRVTIPALNNSNVEFVAQAIANVFKDRA
jgi:aspartate/tyrosine/aromatic aminotransferase